MKGYVWLVLLGGLVGCDSQPQPLEMMSTLYTNSRGVVLFDNSPEAVVGMEGMACSVNSFNAETGEDIDLSEEDETVHDGSGIPGDGSVVLTSNSTGLYVLRGEMGSLVPNDFYDMQTDTYTQPTFYFDNMQDAVITEDGIIALDATSSGCDVHFIAGEHIVATQALSSSECAVGSHIEPMLKSGQAFVAGPMGLIKVTQEGVTRLDDVSDLVAWDAQGQRLFAARKGSDQAKLMDASGDVLRSMTLDGPMYDLKAIKNAGGFAATVELDREGGFATYDSDGHLEMLARIPTAVPFSVNSDGTKVAFDAETAVHFFKLHR